MIDSDLGFLAKLINHTKGSFGVTLFVKGAVVSGWIISGEEYYSTALERLENAGEDAQPHREHFEHMKSLYSGEKLNELEVHNYLHLSNVKIQSGSGHFTTMNGYTLRLKMEEIDGYMIGNPDSN